MSLRLIRKHERAFRIAERKHIRNVLRVIKNEYEIGFKSDPSNIDIALNIRRPSVKKMIHNEVEKIFLLGEKQALEEIDAGKEKLGIAGAASKYKDGTVFLSTRDNYIIDYMTEATIDSMADMGAYLKPEVIETLQEGYAQGESIPKLNDRIQAVWGMNSYKAMRFVRTETNEVYNLAHLTNYRESGIVEAVQVISHLDERTSPECRMLNLTIWRLNDPARISFPAHFNCRTRTVAYFGKIPGPRNFNIRSDGKVLDDQEVKGIFKDMDKFRSDHWNIPSAEILARMA